MSLENEIKTLTAAVLALTAAMGKAQAAPVEKQPVAKTEKTKPVVTPAPIVEAETEAPTEASLQALCMSIVKANRNKMASIKAIVAKYKEAKTIGQVDAKHYPELQTLLEVLRDE